MADFSVKFNNYDLNLIPNLEFYRRFPNNEAEIALTEYDIIRREGSVITDSKHKSKIITLEGYIQAPTRVAYEQALDELKFRTSGTNKRLIIQQGGSDRVYEATKENIIDKHIEAGKSEISVSFRCSDPLGSSALPQIDSFSTTSASFSLPHEFVGTAPTYPIISIAINSLTGGTNKVVGIGESTTGQQLQVQRTWTSGDVVKFDIQKFGVYVNNVPSDYSGSFFTAPPRTSSVYYYDTLTTRDADINLSYDERYL